MAHPLVMVLPIGIEDDFVAALDLMTENSWIWSDVNAPASYTIGHFPDGRRVAL